MENGGWRRRRLSTQSLPEEILEQIIGRVGCVKSLVRWTSVCKSWYCFITSASFVNCHLSLLQPKYLVCKFDESKYAGILYEDKIESGQRDDQIDAFHPCSFAIHSDTEALDEYCRLEFPANLLQLDSCNGLICYNTCDDPETLCLWNPFIRKFKLLPPIAPKLNNMDQHSVFKLWFDSKTNGHNILRISYTDRSCSVEVYSLSTSCWKIITDDAPVTTSFLNSNRLVYVNRTFYWPALRDGNWTLISLQVDNWMFRERLTSWTASRLYLTPSTDNGSLVILGNGDKDDVMLDLLAFMGESFHSLNIFNTMDTRDAHEIDGHYQPLGVRNNGELLLQNIDEELNLISYCVETKQYKDFVPTTSRRLMWTIPFGPTLVLLNDSDADSAA